MTASDVGALPNTTPIPTKTSDLTNDSGFITASSLPTRTSQLTNDSGFITSGDIPTIPTKTSDLTNDSGFITSSSLPTKVSDLTNDTGFITNTTNNLTNYYTKINTYTKTEVDQLIGAISTLDIQIVQTLPSTGSTSTIYLVPKTASTNDSYDEYIYVNNNWEHIGSTEVDLTNYYTKTETDNLLDDKVEYIDASFLWTAAENNTAITSAQLTLLSSKNVFYIKIMGQGEPTKYYFSDGIYYYGSPPVLKKLMIFRKDSATEYIFSIDKDRYVTKREQGIQEKLVSGTNIKTINNTSLLGSGDISVSTFSGDYDDLTDKPIYDVEYVFNAVGSTITNDQYDELYSAISNKLLLKSRDSSVWAINPYGGPQITLGCIVGRQFEQVGVSKTVNNHTVTQTSDTYLAFEDDIEALEEIDSVLLSGIAQFYDSTSTYNVGDYVWGGEEIPSLYKCIVNNTTGTWDSTKWTQVAVMDEVENKQDALVSGTNIKTINSQSILGSGDITTFSGNYNDLTNKPTIPTVPTNVSSFTNDAGYITSSALSGYATTTALNTVQDQVDTNTADIGDLAYLETTDVTNLVAAINEIYEDNYFKPGDTYVIRNYASAPGYITSSNKNLNFPLTLPKSLKNINTITITTMSIDARVPAGAYAVNNYSVHSSGVSIGVEKRDDKTIDISLKRTTNWYGTNNIPISVAIYPGATITFS